jgi:hypothetical protein
MHAWDGCGHKTVAAIAYNNLSSTAKKKVDALFKKDKRSRQFIDSATWPDDIKLGLRNDLTQKAPINRGWHYVDIPFDTDEAMVDGKINNGFTVDPAHENSANVVTGIRFYVNQLKANKGTATEKADALSWLIHLAGDVHQPLHCVTVLTPLDNYTPPQKGDEGGNGFNVHHPAKELHALWDDMFDEPTGGRHNEGRDSSDETAKKIAQDLNAKVHPDASALAKMEPADWAKESFAFRKFAYSPVVATNTAAANPAHEVTGQYFSEAQKDAEERVVLAGLRLAKLLESIYGQ